MNAVDKIKSFFKIDQMTSSGRNLHVDALKGMAIICVVIIHSIQHNNPNYDNNALHNFLFPVQMPLFMLLSGFIISSQLKNTFLAYFKKYLLRLIVPFFVWATVSYVVYRFYLGANLPAYLLSVAKAPDTGLWFLWVLFLESILLFSVLKLVQIKNWIRWENYFVIASIILARLASTDLFGLSEFRLYYPYYAAGYFAFKYYDVLKEKRNLFYFAAVIGFPILILGWKRNAFPTFYPVLVNIFGETGFARLIISIYKYVVAFLGMMFLSFLLERIRNTRFYLFLCWVGTLTLDIYVCHGYFIFKFGDRVWQCLSSAAIAIVCSLALTLLFLKRFKVTRTLFLGQSL
ncbi:MAG: acyltransferase [Smithella sp.]|jgi:fucose 4-O-acetylase-like acetyltransferase|nr:acyltransferase family protein [Candidatus Margulisiibacteriota bacterium]